mmetsp:Transcript_23075/g.58285  ORF Transcript_23075/g.58285 Transcript_23075/m.58285 type:complete len:241 (+) Transcript_23075:254-976(+)
MPLFGAHSKYPTPMTEPLCTPASVSNSTPIHSPFANFTEPMNFTTPDFPLQETFWPTVKLSTGAGAAAAGAAAGGAGAAGAGACADGAGAEAPCKAAACEKMPLFGAQVKYSLPMTVPLCMPESVSNSTPIHSPVANFTAPTNCTTPDLPFHDTFCPTLKPPLGAGAAATGAGVGGAAATGAGGGGGGAAGATGAGGAGVGAGGAGAAGEGVCGAAAVRTAAPAGGAESVGALPPLLTHG